MKLSKDQIRIAKATALYAAGLIVGLGTLWMNLAFTFVTLYNLFNAIILYKAKKAYDS